MSGKQLGLYFGNFALTAEQHGSCSFGAEQKSQVRLSCATRAHHALEHLERGNAFSKLIKVPMFIFVCVNENKQAIEVAAFVAIEIVASKQVCEDRVGAMVILLGVDWKQWITAQKRKIPRADAV